MTTKIFENLLHFELRNFTIETLKIESEVLKNNPLKDPWVRYNPLLIPRKSGPWPVVFVLGGFTGNAPFYFNSKFNELNMTQVIDNGLSQGEAPEALYVFVDALTAWGGSQFINSKATGNYEDYIINEIVPSLKKHYPVAPSGKDWAIIGGSSGGYGALHLSSKYPEIFPWAGALAPDSFFEASLLPDLYQALPDWEKYKESPKSILNEIRSGKIMKKRNWHSLLNAFGMAACYSPYGENGDFEFPLDSKTGTLRQEIWQKWKERDPLIFIKQRIPQLRHLSGLYLSSGDKDNFNLQYGSKQISLLLKENQIEHDYSEFEGNHFDLGERRIDLLKWLNHKWKV